MNLTDLWRKTPQELETKNLQQLLSFAGDGKLKDNSATSKEFREFISIIPTSLLTRYIKNCFESSFDESWFALQDMINETGKRLGYKVEFGRYKGLKGKTGNDGLWESSAGHHLIIEIKTTDAYRLSLDTLEKYRKELINNGKCNEDKSSILIVVGRFDTGEIEAQIRGSKHAWSARLISVEYLIKLLHLKEEMDNASIHDKIRSILLPHEYTKIDGIIDLAFSATEDIKDVSESIPEEEENLTQNSPSGKGHDVTAKFHDGCILRIERYLKSSLTKQSRTTYLTSDGKTEVVCLVSKSHTKNSENVYWFGFHLHHKNFFELAKKGYLSLGCGSSNLILLIPKDVFLGWLDNLFITEKDDRMYWHISIHQLNGDFRLYPKAGKDKLLLNSFILK